LACLSEFVTGRDITFHKGSWSFLPFLLGLDLGSEQ